SEKFAFWILLKSGNRVRCIPPWPRLGRGRPRQTTEADCEDCTFLERAPQWGMGLRLFPKGYPMYVDLSAAALYAKASRGVSIPPSPAFRHTRCRQAGGRRSAARARA